MKIAFTGASGLVGHPIALHLRDQGHQVTTLGRQPVDGFAHLAWTLGDDVGLERFDALVHAGFAHIPGRYRGGEGNDPQGFVLRNLDGTRHLFDAARKADLRVLFTSSRAVYGPHPPGTILHEGMTPAPDTLYGLVKLKAEQALAGLGTSLRITGVFGPPVPGRVPKWDELFRAFRAGQTIAPRVATEVHAQDVARAVSVLLDHPAPPDLVNVSGFVLDRRDLLERYARITGRTGSLPERADPSTLNVMDTTALQALGWAASGPEVLDDTLRALIGQ